MSIKVALLKNTLFNLLGYLYLLLASFFSITILLNNLGRDMFGVYLFLSSFVPFVSVFDFGISLASIRELSLPSTPRSEKVKVWQTSLAIYVFISFVLVIFVSLLLLYLFRSMPLLTNSGIKDVYPIIFSIAVTIFINHINNILLSIPQANQRFDIFNSKTFLVGTANTLLTSLLTYYTQNISTVFFLQFAFHLLTFLFVLNYALKNYTYSELLPGYHRSTGKKLLAYGLKNFVGTLAGQVEAQISKFFLGFLSTAQAISSFSIPQNIVTKGAGVVSQFAQAFFPLSASLLEKDRIVKLKKLYIGLQVIILSGGVLSVFCAYYFGEEFLLWWLKDQVIVSTAYPALKVLSFYFLLLSLTPIPTALVQGLGKPQIPSFFAILTLVLEASFMFFLIPKYQTLGAAYALLGSLVITVPTFLLATKVIFGNYIKKILSPV